MPAHPLPPVPSPVVISMNETHLVIAIELSRDMLANHLRFLESLVAAARTSPGRD